MEIRRVFRAILFIVLVVLVGTFGYMILGDWSFMDSLWVTFQTITTVGFGDIVIDTPALKLFTMFLMVTGVGFVVYAFGTVMGTVMEGQIRSILGRRTMKKQLSRMENHIIVCGAGRVGAQVVQRLSKEQVPFVVIDQNEHLIQELQQRQVLALLGDATEDEILIEAGIHRAKGLVTTLSGDAANVFVTLTAKGLNTQINVVARADRLESEEKLRRAGADKVIAPSVIGGRRMAISILKPASVDFVETLIHCQVEEIEIEEVMINSKSPLMGKDIKNSGIKQTTGAMVLAIQRPGEILSNPSADEIIQSGDLLIVMGTREQLAKLEKMAQGNT